MRSNIQFQDCQFDPSIARNNVPAVVAKLFRGYGSDKTLDYEVGKILHNTYTTLLQDPTFDDADIGF